MKNDNITDNSVIYRVIASIGSVLYIQKAEELSKQATYQLSDVKNDFRKIEFVADKKQRR